MPQPGQAIDLSAGLIPKPAVGNEIDISAGLIPRQSAPQQSGMGAFYEASGAKGLVDSLRHPLDTASTILDAGKRVFTPGQPQRMSDNPNPIIRGIGEQVEPFGNAIKRCLVLPEQGERAAGGPYSSDCRAGASAGTALLRPRQHSGSGGHGLGHCNRVSRTGTVERDSANSLRRGTKHGRVSAGLRCKSHGSLPECWQETARR